MHAVHHRSDAWPRLGARGEGWIGIQTLGIVAVLLGGYVVPTEWTGLLRVVAFAAGAALAVAGVTLFAWGSWTLGRLFSIWVAPRPAGHVVTTGPYRFVRHPVCSGQVLFAFGYALMRGSLPAVALALLYLAVVFLKVTREEAWLRATYPDYAAFAARTRHRLIPGLL
jgi:protein-S-isoprenylcysteine O-methyltransferase Ste14